jgi:hypothetical protein
MNRRRSDGDYRFVAANTYTSAGTGHVTRHVTGSARTEKLHARVESLRPEETQPILCLGLEGAFS